jgi:hypothetical protein
LIQIRAVRIHREAEHDDFPCCGKVVPTVETVIVDIIEEPVPGVMVVTEFEATGIRGPNAKSKQSEESRATTPPKSEER